MKPEISQVLIPSTKEKSTSSLQTTPCIITLPDSSSSTSHCCSISKWLIGLTLLLAVTVSLAGGAMLLRYEGKLEEYETRISMLEAEVTELFDHLNLKVDGEDEDDDLSFDDLTGIENSLEAKGLKFFPSKEDYSSGEDKEDTDNVKEEEEVVFGEIKEIGNPGEHLLSRSKRQASIRDGSYGTGNNRIVPTVGPTESEGLRLYESLIATRGRGEPTSASFQESSGSNVKPYHRQSAAWSEKDEQRSQLQLKSGDMNLGDDDLYSRPSRRHISDSLSGDQTFTRSSRVPATGDQIYQRAPGTREYQYPPLQRLGRGEGEVIARVHQENPTDRRQETRTHRERPRHDPDHVIAAASQGDTVTSFAESRRYKGGFRQNQGRNRQRNRVNGSGSDSDSSSASGSDEFTFTKAEASAEIPKTYAAHYVADVSNYSLSHRHYEGNGRLRNADGIFSSWKPASWMAASAISKEVFSLSATGVLTVRKDGLYYIYAQIHYLDDHDINGFMIQVNAEPFLQCTTMTETRSTNPKSNTCFTGGVTHLKENDRILLRDMETNRYSILKPEKSFFGLMRIGNAVGR